jgi:glycosyltransferase involved in cell wall biosynthesis
MKTLFFCNLVPDKEGAFERVLVEIGRQHSFHGDSLILVLAGEPIGKVGHQFREAGIQWRVITGWGEQSAVHPWRLVLPGLRLLREFRPDVAVVHFGNELPSLLLSLVAPIVGVRNVKWVWQQDQQIGHPRGIARWVSRVRALDLTFARFVAVYEGGRAAMVARGLSRDRISVVHNGVADPEPGVNRASARSLLNAAEQEVILINAGSMIPRKRQAALINVMAEVVREAGVIPVRLILAGEGPDRVNLERKVEEMGLKNRVTFLGKRNDVGLLLCGADVLVHAAIAEGCAYALSEGMAAGLPLVVTDAGAAREQVLDGVNGYVVQAQDPVMFGDRLKELIRSATLRNRMGRASRARWTEGFKVENQSRECWGIYRALSEGRA